MINGNDGGANVSFNGGRSWTEQDQARATEQWTYVATDAPVKFVVMKLRNHSGSPRRLSVTGLFELVLGTRGRSGGQWDIWEAVFSPNGADGYPQRIWDKRTGVIDKQVAGVAILAAGVAMVALGTAG